MGSRGSGSVYTEYSLDELDYGKGGYPLVEGREDEEILSEVFLQFKVLEQSFSFPWKRGVGFMYPFKCLFLCLGSREGENFKNIPNNKGMVVGE